MDSASVTQHLHQWQAGDAQAGEALIAALYPDLKRMARHQMNKESAGHTLQTTALVHEAWMRSEGLDLDIADRNHFLALCSRVMRRVLVDHARARDSHKRGAGAVHLSLDDALTVAATEQPRFLDLDAALTALGQLDPRKEAAVVASYFGGMTRAEIAEVHGVSVVTIERDIRFARAWLNRALDDTPAQAP